MTERTDQICLDPRLAARLLALMVPRIGCEFSGDDIRLACEAFQDHPGQQLLDRYGYRVEGPGGSADDDLAGRYWWTCSRDGWSDVETSSTDHATADEARGAAVAAMLVDSDIELEVTQWLADLSRAS